MKKARKPGSVRIIAGKWRGRQVKVVDHSQLRPTPDRVRETLFNWLTGSIPNTRCLDLFAGTGVLGFEALSRGAREVVFVDHHVAVVKALKNTALDLDVKLQCHIILDESLRWLKRVQHESEPFDIIFLDPPYSSMLLKQSISLLSESTLIHPHTIIYAESPVPLVEQNIPSSWQLLKEQKASEVMYYLLRASLS